MDARLRVEPAPCRWSLPDPGATPPGEDVVAVGADLAPGTILAAYRRGMFPMAVDSGRLGWWSPDPRGVLAPTRLRVPDSLRRSMRRFTFTVDVAFGEVVAACRAARPESEWITEEFVAAYQHLHELGWAHSVEAWRGPDLVGGVYGVELGGLFCGESMFHRERDASKAANAHLCAVLVAAGGDRLVDVQWCTDHLASLGAVEVPRADYLARLPALLAVPPAL